jgi:hypothetical protein
VSVGEDAKGFGFDNRLSAVVDVELPVDMF